MKKIVIVIGTRPEAIKCAPIINAAKSRFNHHFEINVVTTSQHKEVLDDVFDCFGISPNHILELNRTTTLLSELQSQLVFQLEQYFIANKPDIVLVQGDTISTLSGAMAAFFQKIPIAYVESGLRSNSLSEPFPEEGHRRIITPLCKWHFTPTASATKALETEGIIDNIYEVGNTVVDALDYVNNIGFKNKDHQHEWVHKKNKDRKTVLVTIHRRENWTHRFESIMNALKQVASSNPTELDIVWVSHPNPNLIERANLAFKSFENIYIYPPANYFQLLHLMSNSYLVLSDSGGIQEEAPSFNVPVLVARKVTERMEGINLGCAKLVGTDETTISKAIQELLSNKGLYQQMSGLENPYGNGTASDQILEILSH